MTSKRPSGCRSKGNWLRENGTVLGAEILSNGAAYAVRVLGWVECPGKKKRQQRFVSLQKSAKMDYEDGRRLRAAN
jgi:hypothetical protein